MKITPPSNIDESWLPIIKKVYGESYWQKLDAFLEKEHQEHTIYPPAPEILNTFILTPMDQVQVVILGQDPYHGPGQAHGLCFSVPRGIKIPPSLRNILKEIETDLQVEVPSHGNLEHWAKQGVFLLNSTLTVRSGQAGSHQKKGWESFTDHIIQTLSREKEHLVFMLWGRFARDKKKLIDNERHLILEAAHPSPLSAYQGFFGCQHFSKANQYLAQHKKKGIMW